MSFGNLKKYFITALVVTGSIAIISIIYFQTNFLKEKKLSKKELFKYDNKFDKINDAALFLEIYQKTHSSANENAKVIINHVFQAQKYADQLDEINSKSNSLFKKAIELSRQNKNRNFEIWTNLNYAYYLYSFRKFEESYPYFMFCVEQLNSTDSDQIINPIDTYKKISYFFITANENDLAINYLKKAEKIAEPQSLDMASIKDVIGLAYISKNEDAKAKKYFEDALRISRNVKDYSREAKTLGNLAEVDFRNKNYDEAIVKLKNDIAISEKNKNDQNSMFARIKLCKFYLKMGNVSEAEKNIKSAEKYAYSKPYFKRSLYEINKFLLEIAKIQGNVEKELKARRTMDILADSLKTLDGQNVVNFVRWEARKKTLEYNIKFEKDKYEKEFFLKIIAYLISAGLLIMITINIIMTRKKTKTQKITYQKNLLDLENEKLISENKLNSTSKTVLSYRNYLLEKNAQIEQLEAELSKTQTLRKSNNIDYVVKLDDLLKSHLLTAENWKNFKAAFENEKSEYAEYLGVNFPNLTEANLRVIYLSQLELNNSEIARILGVTLSAVKKAKQRLRIKYKDDYDKFFESNN